MLFGGGGREWLVIDHHSVHHGFGFSRFKLVAQVEPFLGPFVNIIEKTRRIAVCVLYDA
jgi:hypothetical protein